MVKIVGSYSKSWGLPLYETTTLLAARAIRSGSAGSTRCDSGGSSIWRVMIESAPGPKLSNLPQADGRGLSAVLLQALR